MAVSSGPRALIGAIILAGIAINFANVIGRYVFLAPLDWAEEVMVYLIVWAVFLGAVVVTFEKRHLAMDIVLKRLPPRPQRALRAVILTVLVLCCGFVCIQAARIVELMGRLDQKSIVVGIPMTLPYLAFVVGFGLMVLAALAAIRWRARPDVQPDDN